MEAQTVSYELWVPVLVEMIINGCDVKELNQKTKFLPEN